MSKRLMTEYKELTINPPEGIQAGPMSESNWFLWEAFIEGPKVFPSALSLSNQDTIYEDGIFIATLTFPKDYPLSPPIMKFTSEIWHPNS
jgi:ubiquitin-conjugating enzyme E2 G2